MSNAEIATLVISLISIIASIIIPILIYIWSKKNTSTDYKLKDTIIEDLLILEGNLNSICIKLATCSQIKNELNLEKEKEFVKKFLTSPTMSFILIYDNSKTDQLFYLDLFLIANESTNLLDSAVLAKNTLEMLHNMCKGNLIDKLKKISSVECLQKITNDKVQINQLLQTSHEIVDEYSQKNDSTNIQKLKFLKKKGVKDPYVDLFLELHSKEPNKQKIKKSLDECIKQYGSANITDKEVLEKYQDYLTDFIPA